MDNANDDLSLKIYRLVDNTMYPHHLLKQGPQPYSSIKFDRKRSTTNIFGSFSLLIPIITLLSYSIAVYQSQRYSEPTLILVSSLCIQKHSAIFFSCFILYSFPFLNKKNMTYFNKPFQSLCSVSKR